MVENDQTQTVDAIGVKRLACILAGHSVVRAPSYYTVRDLEDEGRGELDRDKALGGYLYAQYSARAKALLELLGVGHE